MIFMVERLTAETWTRSAVAGMPASLTRMRLIGGILIVGWSMVVPGALAENAAESASGGGDLTGFTLEQLVNVQVTSVSKRSESLSQASAAITTTDITRLFVEFTLAHFFLHTCMFDKFSEPTNSLIHTFIITQTQLNHKNPPLGKLNKRIVSCHSAA